MAPKRLAGGKKKAVSYSNHHLSVFRERPKLSLKRSPSRRTMRTLTSWTQQTWVASTKSNLPPKKRKNKLSRI